MLALNMNLEMRRSISWLVYILSALSVAGAEVSVSKYCSDVVNVGTREDYD